MVSPPPPVISTPSAESVAAPTLNVPPPAASAPAVASSTPTMAPIVHQPDPTPVARSISSSARTTTATRAPASTARSQPAPSVTSAPVAAVANRQTAAAPVSSNPAIPAPVGQATPAAAPASQPATQMADDDTLPIAGGVGAAVLLLAGGAFALSRRRRRRRDEDEVVYETTTETLVADHPAIVPAVAAAIPTRSAKTLPSGFDISRFGPHTQAAYRGPTEANPSLSLRKRLKIASFYDGRERMAAEDSVRPTAPAKAVAVTAATVKATPAKAARQSDHITVRPKIVRPNFKPAFSS